MNFVIERNNSINFNKIEKDLFYQEEKDYEIDLAKSFIKANMDEDVLNLSDNCAKSINFEKNQDNTVIENEERERNTHFKITEENFKPIINTEESQKSFDIKIKYLEEENLQVKKSNEILLLELQNTKLELSKNSYEKLSLFSELNELLDSLSRIDLDELNEFYLSKITNVHNRKNSIYSAMGIKYNLLSVVNSLGLHAMNHSFPYNQTINDNDDRNNLNKTQNENLDKTEYLGQFFCEKYLENIKENFHKYDDELNNYVYYHPDKINKSNIKNSNTVIKNIKNISQNLNQSQLTNNYVDNYTKNKI